MAPPPPTYSWPWVRHTTYETRLLFTVCQPRPPPLSWRMLVGGGGLWGMRVFGGEEMGTFWPKRGIFFMIRQPPPQPRREGCCLEGGFGGSCFMVRIGALWVCKGMGMVASQEVYVRPAGPLSGAPWTGAGRCPETYCLEPSRGFLWIPRKFIRKKKECDIKYFL